MELKKQGVRMRNGLNWLRIGPSVALCEYVSDLRVTHKVRKF
jgi:hypothetical protein